MPFVLDASIVIDWALDEGNPTAAAALERLTTDTALSPTLLWFEVRNGLITAERRGRANEGSSTSFLRRLGRVPLALDATPDETMVMTLARRHRLTVYDAAYLELALREGASLATLDGPLAAAARAEGIELVGG